MKAQRIHIHWLFAGILCLAAVGCTLQIPDSSDPEVALTFDPVLYAPVKATSGAFPADKEFNVSVWSYSSAENVQTAKPFLTGARVTRSGSVWVPEPAVLWPGRGSRLAALAASPYGAASGISLAEGVEFTDFDTADQTDLLYTDPVSGLVLNATGGVVNLPFHHALSLLDFEMRSNATDSQTATLLSASIDPLYCRGSFASLPEPFWTTSGEAQEVRFFAGEQVITHSNEPIGESRWTIPQQLSARVSILFRLRDGEEETTHTFQSAPFRLLMEPGRHYTLTLSCLLDAMELKIVVLDDLI